MFYNNLENGLVEKDNKKEDVERVYVDWPDMDSDEFRFISSRMEDVDEDNLPLDLQQNNLFPNLDVNQLKYNNEKPPKVKSSDDRYEDPLKRRKSKKIKNSSVPPLDLISQNSSIEIPGTKGIIDIDLRSSSESLSDSSREYNEQLEHFERDSLDVNKSNYYPENNKISSNNIYNPLLNTNLPVVKHSDLMLNPEEYDTSRYNPNIMRKFSEISIPSQYRSVPTTKEVTSSKVNDLNDQRLQNEKAAFEAARQKYIQPLRNNSHSSIESQKLDSSLVNQPIRTIQSKPTLLVAPQIKQQLNSASNSDKNNINFIELNKITTNALKQNNQSSYTSKFIDRHKKESPKAALKKSESFKDSLQFQTNTTEKSYIDQNNDYSKEEFLNRRGRSVEKMSNEFSRGDRQELPFNDNNYSINYIRPPEVFKTVNPSHLIYAYNQFGEPVTISTDNYIIANNNSKTHHNSHMNYSQYPNHPEFYPNSNMIKEYPSIPNSPSTHSKLYPNNQELNRSNESEIIFKDASFKRQPTLYDENLLTKKLKDVKNERSISRFPPIPNSSDSSMSQSNNSGYAANHRKKEINYEQYTLRDFKNLKQIDRVGGLGPNIGSDSYKQMKEKLVRQKIYAKAVQEKNKQEIIKQNEKVNRDMSQMIDNNDDNKQNYEPITTNTVENKEKSFATQQKNAEHFNEIHSDNTKEEKFNSNSKTMTSYSAKDNLNKRDAMLIYAKSIQEKQIKKRDSKTQIVKTSSLEKEINKLTFHELIDNSDLDRLVQRHENDKKIADQIRQKLGKIS